MKKHILSLLTSSFLMLAFFVGCQQPETPQLNGAIQGSIKIDGSTDNVLGVDIFIAGTSYSSKVDASGNFMLSDILPKTDYTLCIQKDNCAKIIKEGVEVKAGEHTVLEQIDIVSKDFFDKYNGILDLENFLAEKVILVENQYSEGGREKHLYLPYTKQLPNIGDQITLEFEFTSDTNFKDLYVRFADDSVYVNSWLDLTGKDKEDWPVINEIKKDDIIKFSHTYTLMEKPVQRMLVNLVSYDDSFDKAELTILNSKLTVTSSTGIPNYKQQGTSATNNNQITCTATTEGIKFTGALLSNTLIDDTNTTSTKCTIYITEMDNGITMENKYTLKSDTWESWEYVYPLVKKDKEYSFEVKIAHNSAEINMATFIITAIGGLGEYKVENSSNCEIKLTEDKKTLTRTPQIFSNNQNVKIIDYGTHYDVYSCADSATDIYDGAWCHGDVIWQSDAKQICNLEHLQDWLPFDVLNQRLKGRKLGVKIQTKIKLAGYTNNNTTTFNLNDSKQNFFDWDNEKPNQYLLIYRDPSSQKIYTDVPDTKLYYISEQFDKNGNVIFVDKSTVGAIAVYGKLINWGDKITEPIYVPKFENSELVWNNSWNAYCKDQEISSIKFKYNSQDFWFNGNCIPVYLEPGFITENDTIIE